MKHLWGTFSWTDGIHTQLDRLFTDAADADEWVTLGQSAHSALLTVDEDDAMAMIAESRSGVRRWFVRWEQYAFSVDDDAIVEVSRAEVSRTSRSEHPPRHHDSMRSRYWDGIVAADTSEEATALHIAAVRAASVGMSPPRAWNRETRDGAAS